MIVGIRPQDVTPDLPASVSQLKLKPEEMSAALLSSDVNVHDLAAGINKMRKVSLVAIHPAADYARNEVSTRQLEVGILFKLFVSHFLFW